MDAPQSTPPATIRLTPPSVRNVNSPAEDDVFLRTHFSEAEYDIITKKANSQMVKSWIFFYRFCLKDPLAFALVK